jgi:hypothetical protein
MVSDNKINISMTNLDEMKQEVFDYAKLRLGYGMIDIELDPAHFEVAYKHAIGKYRQRAQNANEEAYVWIDLQEGTSTYTLPQEVTEVRQVFRRTFGSIGGDSAFDPFSSAVINTYILNLGGSGGLATWELYTQKLELAARMFGGYMNFTFNPSTKRINLVRNITSSGETVLLWTYNLKPEIQLLTELQISQWIKEYTYATCKQMVGEAREKFQSIAGPNGGTSLNGSQLKSEATAEMAQLIEDLKHYIDGSDALSWVIG